jgi:hypothetical protein
MLSLRIIKQTFAAIGINGLAVKFDQANNQIIATYQYANTRHRKVIPFAEVEAIFSVSQGAGPGSIEPDQSP